MLILVANGDKVFYGGNFRGVDRLPLYQLWHVWHPSFSHVASLLKHRKKKKTRHFIEKYIMGEKIKRIETMLEPYIKAAMKKARYEILPDDSTFYGEIVGFDGVYANAPTLETCQHELESVLEGWISLRISLNFPLPDIEGAQAHKML